MNMTNNVKESLCSTQLSDLSAVLDEVLKSTVTLRDKLCPVLPVVTKSVERAPSEDIPAQAFSPLAKDIKAQVDKGRTIRAALTWLIQNVEC